MSEFAHIALFLPSLREGGAERVMVTLANAFAERGHRVDLVLGERVGPYLRDVASAVRVVDLRAGRMSRAVNPLRRYLRRERPSVLLSTMVHANVIAVLARMLLIGRRPRLVLREAALPDANREAMEAGRIGHVYRLARWLYPRADLVVSVSGGVRASVDERIPALGRRSVTIANPAISPALRRAAERPIEPDHLRWFDRPVVMAMGRLVDVKGFDVLLDAFAQLTRERDCRLLILGSGPLCKSLQEQARALGIDEVLEMPGFVHDPHRYLAMASLFVLSSRSEGLPNALIEALALGTPVVSTRTPYGPDEILENGRLGMLVPVDDPEAMAEAMSEALDRPRLVPEGDPWWMRFEREAVVSRWLEALVPEVSP